MINSETRLLRLVDHIRKDAGINNAIDAMEQFSLILLLKYFHESILKASTRQEHSNSFKSLFFKSNEHNNGDFEEDFLNLKSILDDFTYNIVSSTNNGYAIETWNKAKVLLDFVPLKIRSVKTLELLLHDLDSIDISESLADDYNKLVVKMINDSLSAGAFYSPRALVSAIVKVVKPSPEQSIYDPAMGTGGFFIEAKKQVAESAPNNLNESWQINGKDISSFACLIGSVNLLLNGININNITLADSLLTTDNQHYDIIFCGAPFGKLSNIDRYKYSNIRNTSSIEAMFLEHSMRVLSIGGKAALIVPDGLLFNRTNDLIELRWELLTKFNLHTILSLPPGTLAPASGVKVSVLFFDNIQPQEDIWFYELATKKPLSKINPISNDDLKEFTSLFTKRSWSSHSSLINKQDILRDEHVSLSLTLSKTVDKKNDVDLLKEVIDLEEKQQDINLLMLKLSSSLRKSKNAKFVKKVTLGDLFKTRAGQPLNKTMILEEGPFPVYGANGIMGYFNESNRHGESILIGRVGAYCGNVSFVKGDVWVTDNAFSLEFNLNQNVFLPYLAHVLKWLNLNKFARGVAQPSISYSTIKDIEIYLPTYEQQVELSNWFEEVELNYLNLENEVEAQKEKIKELTGYVIFSNCIKADENF